MKKTLSTPSAPKALGPYSHVVESGGWVYISGQIPIDPASGAVVEGGIDAQAARVLDTIEALLADAHLSTDHVVKTTIYLKDLGDFEQVNAVYATRFRPPYPARATVEVSALPKGVGIEIDAVAHRPSSEAL